VLEREMEEFLVNSNTPKEWLDAMEVLILSRVDNIKNDNYSAIAIFAINEESK
jgi:hypothetical protein